MKTLVRTPLLLLGLLSVLAPTYAMADASAESPAGESAAGESSDVESSDVESRIVETAAGELVLVQELVIDAPVERVWAAYTTDAGWESWAAPHAEVDLRVGGTIRTHYGAEAKVGDPGTVTLHIVNYVPEKVLTLQAELSDRWPDVMKDDAEHLMNVIVFDRLGENTTRIRSYGVGYRDAPAYDELMQFFISANEGLLRTLKSSLEGSTGAE